jgi:PAS domain S-box-containing protein
LRPHALARAQRPIQASKACSRVGCQRHGLGGRSARGPAPGLLYPRLLLGLLLILQQALGFRSHAAAAGIELAIRAGQTAATPALATPAAPRAASPPSTWNERLECVLLRELAYVCGRAVRYRLRQSNQLLVAALESARDGICLTDLHGNMFHVNKALEAMTGYDRQELIGQNPRLFKSSAHSPDFFADLWRTILARQSWQGEMINRRKDGALVDTSLTISPIVDNRGQLTHFAGIFRDITERKQLERQLLQAQKNAERRHTGGRRSHESTISWPVFRVMQR